MIEKRDFYINGGWTAPAEARDCEVIDPSTEEACAVISLGDQADTDAAVAAAKAAFEGWAATPPAERLRLVKGILAQYEARKEEMAQAISLEMGAPIDLARNSQAPCLPWHLTNFLKAFEEIEWVRPLGPHAPNDRIALEPIGVVGLITPWNWPMNQVTLKVIPALLAGCTCVLKPSEEAPLSSLLFAEFVHDAGLPAGVFNLVNGDGAGVGTQLSLAPGCRDDLLHRLDPRGPRDLEGCGRVAQARDAGARRQGREPDLRRCRRARGRAGREALFQQLGPELQRPDPDAGRAATL